MPKRQRAQRRRARQARGGRGDASALRGIKQGVGRSVLAPYGAVSVKRFHPCVHDAFHHAHLPLPRAVGPYTVVRTTQYSTDAAPLTIMGPVLNHGSGEWTDIAGIKFKDDALDVGSAGNVELIKFTALDNASWNGAQIVPAAFSIQIMNPNALQVTSGIVYIGRVRTSLKPSETLTKKVADLANQLLSYNNPRLCSAAKLAFRGVQIDLVPFNMSELANFTIRGQDSFTQYGAASPNPYGFAPAFIWNPNKISLQFLIACEWRVRFDPSNPAQATHIHHPPASESVWARAQQFAESVGNGVIDIADRVANTGMAVGRALGVARALRGAGGALALGM